MTPGKQPGKQPRISDVLKISKFGVSTNVAVKLKRTADYDIAVDLSPKKSKIDYSMKHAELQAVCNNLEVTEESKFDAFRTCVKAAGIYNDVEDKIFEQQNQSSITELFGQVFQKFEQLSSALEATKSTLETSIQGVINNANATRSSLETSIQGVVNNANATKSSLETSIQGVIDNAKATKSDLETQIKGVSTNVETANRTLTTQFKDITTKLDETKIDITAKVEKVSSKLETIDNDLKKANKKLEVVDKRFSAISSACSTKP